MAGDFAQQDAVLKEHLVTQERYRVRPEEIVALTQKWGTYKGRQIGTDDVRAWLDQFKDLREQRMMFKILQNVRYYNQNLIRERLSELHQRVVRGMRQRIEKRQRSRKDILVSYPGGEGKSGATYARLYADENAIWQDNVANRDAIVKRLHQDSAGVQAVIFVDDFIGTGDSACGFVNELAIQLKDVPVHPRYVFAAISGFPGAARRIEQAAANCGINLEVLLSDPLDDAMGVLDEASDCFEGPTERLAAIRLVEMAGRQLEKAWPLGYGNCAATVIFDSSCPNNTLPILWKETVDWRPLFPRH